MKTALSPLSDEQHPQLKRMLICEDVCATVTNIYWPLSVCLRRLHRPARHISQRGEGWRGFSPR